METADTDDDLQAIPGLQSMLMNKNVAYVYQNRNKLWYKTKRAQCRLLNTNISSKRRCTTVTAVLGFAPQSRNIFVSIVRHVGLRSFLTTCGTEKQFQQ